jgi:hypothetical protein
MATDMETTIESGLNQGVVPDSSTLEMAAARASGGQ